MKTGNDKGFVDLHVHTTCSDGMFSPEQVVRKAIELDLKAIAITDHDSIEGITPGMEAAAGTGLEIVPGVEISAAVEDMEIHILGYFIDWQDPVLVKTLRKMKENRVERMHEIVRLLREQGIDIDESKVFGAGQEKTLGRFYLARILVEENAVRNTQEAFDRYIGDGKPCHVRHKRLDYSKAIDMIRKAGGVPVLAHPGSMGKDEYISRYVEAGIRGIEVYHSKHGSRVHDKYLKAAKEYGLLITGGSDCHGVVKGKGEVLIGKVKVDYNIVRDLYKEAENIRKGNYGEEDSEG